ncbi:MAG: hypothetical protein HC942_00710 [Microcoleus sp. SU_5_6]|nr:hypothetical protein [Microcoleus sp. SU_5_6]NJS12757.1 hypothetical protein [Microcoleus sp. CSU_2_2]
MDDIAGDGAIAIASKGFSRFIKALNCRSIALDRNCYLCCFNSGLIPLGDQDKTASQGLYDSFEGAAVLAKALAEEKATLGDRVR